MVPVEWHDWHDVYMLAFFYDVQIIPISSA